MQNLPKKYVEQLFRKLKKDLVINSVPGSKGGYYLMMPAHEITLGFIMEIVENHPYEVSCERSKIELEYCQIENCQYRHLWHEVYSNIKNYLNTITLQDIKNRIDKE